MSNRVITIPTVTMLMLRFPSITMIVISPVPVALRLALTEQLLSLLLSHAQSSLVLTVWSADHLTKIVIHDLLATMETLQPESLVTIPPLTAVDPNPSLLLVLASVLSIAAQTMTSATELVTRARPLVTMISTRALIAAVRLPTMTSSVALPAKSLLARTTRLLMSLDVMLIIKDKATLVLATEVSLLVKRKMLNMLTFPM